QTENREDIGCVHDERVTGDGQDGWNRIDGEDQVGGFNDQKREEKWRRHGPTFAAYEEVVSFKVRGNGKEPAKNPQDQILVGVDIGFAVPQKPNAAVNQNGSEDVDKKLKALKKRDPQQNKNKSHDQ